MGTRRANAYHCRVASHAATSAEPASRGRVDEATMRAAGAGFAAVFEQSHVPMNVLSLDGRFLAVNEAYARLVGVPASDLVESNPTITHPDDREKRFGSDARLVAEAVGTGSYRHERRLVRESGSEIWVDSSVTLIRDAAGQPIALLETLVDITATKVAETELQAAAERLALLRDIDLAVLEARSAGEAASETIRRVRPLLRASLAAVAVFDAAQESATVLAVDADRETGVHPGAAFPVAFIDELRAGEILIARDLHLQQELTPVFAAAVAAGAGTFAQVPLLSRGELVGTLAVVLEPGLPFGDGEIEVTREVGRSIAVALQDEAQKDALTASHELLETLVSIDRAILSADSVEEVLSVALQRLRHLLPCVAVAATSIDVERREVTLLAVDSDLDVAVPIGATWPITVPVDELLEGKTRLIPDLDLLDQPSDSLIALAKAAGARSITTVPLVARDAWIGGLSIASPNPGGHSAAHVRLAEEVAASLAVALYDAMRQSKVQASYTLLETVVGIERAILEARSVEELLAATLSKLRKLVPCMAMVASSVDAERRTATILAIDADVDSGLRPGDSIRIVNPVDDLLAGHTRTVPDLETVVPYDTPTYRAARAFGGRSLAAIPLIARGTWIGMLNLASATTDGISDESIRLIEEISPTLAVALQDVAQNDAIEASKELLETVVEVDRAILEARSVEPLLVATMRRLRRLVPCIAIAASSIDLERSETTLLAVEADVALPMLPGMRLELVGPVDDFAAGRSRIVRDLHDVDTSDIPAYALARTLGGRSLAIIPMICRGAWIGTLSAIRVEPDGFSASDIRLMEEIASSLAVALESARMTDELERSAELLAHRVEERTGQLRAVLDATPDAIWAFDATGHTVVSNTPSARMLRDVFGLGADASLEAILGRLAAVTTEPELWSQRADAVLADAQVEFADDVEIQGGGGEFALYTGPVETGGRLVVLRDITSERQAERTKEELMATVSHEIRTPLTGLANAVEILVGRDLPPERRDRYMTLLRTETDRLKELLGEFLDLQSMDRGRLELDPEPFDLAALVRDVAALYIETEPRHAITTRDADEPLVAHADRDRIAQVLGNFASNAVKYSPDGGRVEIAIERRPAMARVTVTDHGLGIPAAEHGLIFTRFFRGRAVVDRSIGGTGLGLALARDIVEASGGQIGFVSRLGHGSSFWFEVPLAGGAR